LSFTYDLTTAAGQVRLLATDTDSDRPIFEDEEIAGFLAIEGSVKTAAALALECIAVNESLVQKRIKILDLQTDGPAVAVALRAQATALREQETDEVIPFATAEFGDGAFAAREKMLKEYLRRGWSDS
jgi:hypothetical protein